jgi:hypothetical protein
MSETVSEAFVKAAARLTNPPKSKTAKGKAYSYKYADLADILDLIRPILAEEGLAVMQDASTFDGFVGVTTKILHTSGGELRFGPLYLGTPSDPQAAGGVITYARRYQLCAALGIAGDDDEDGKSVEGSTAASQHGGDTPAAAQTATLDRGPSASSEEVVAEDHGEGPDATASSDLIDAETLEALIKAWPNRNAALKAAHEAYGVLKLEYLTKAQADEMYDRQVGA